MGKGFSPNRRLAIPRPHSPRPISARRRLDMYVEYLRGGVRMNERGVAMASAQRDDRTALVDDRANGREHGHDQWRRQNANADRRRDSSPHHRDVSRQRISTQVGDVLILQTNKSFTIYAVGLVMKEGQRNFCGQIDVTHAPDRAAALVEAKALLAPGRRIVLRNIDTNHWSETSTRDIRREPHRRHDSRSRELARSA
jgi:hypothetical protein